MITKSITYEDFNGNTRTKDFYFHLSEPELIEMEMTTSGGMEKMLEKILKEEDQAKIIEIFKSIIIKSVGEKTADGDAFLKVRPDGTRVADYFMATNAYPKLFEELSTNADEAARFIRGIMPKKLQEEVAKREAEEKKVTQIPDKNNQAHTEHNR